MTERDDAPTEARSPSPARALDEAEGGALLAGFGVPVARSAVVATLREALAAAAALGYPVVLKGVSARVPHKSDEGLVRVALSDEEALRAAYEALRGLIDAHPEAASFRGILVQEMVPPGIELIVGVRRDPLFGPMLLLGIGGTQAEVLRDTALSKMPVHRDELRRMVARLRGKRLLAGYRGSEPLDMESLTTFVEALNALVERVPALVELDLNPVIARGRSLVACDVLLVLDDRARPPTASRRAASTQEIRRLWSPRSIAVIGASTNPRKNGHRLLKHLVEHGFEGSVFPVNPVATEILGLKAYASVHDIPYPVDLACIITPSEHLLPSLEACAAKGIGAAVVYSSGFAETGPEGAKRQAEIQDLCQRTGLRVVGPNSMGFVNMVDKVYAAFGSVLQSPTKTVGSIAIVSQSGAMGSALLSRAWEDGAGFSHWISVANEVDLNSADFVAALVDDEATKVIALFLEEVRDPERFMAVARRARLLGKPLIAFKTGTSSVGKRAVLSHTGSLAGDDAAYAAAFAHAGIVRAEQLDDLMDVARALAHQPLPRGARMGIVTASGGACSVIADLCASYGLEVPSPPGLSERVAAWIPPFGATENPIDVTAEILAQPETFKNVLEAIIEDEHIDGLIVMLTTNADPGAVTLAEAILDVFRRHEKPVVVGRLGASNIAPLGTAVYRNAGFPVYPSADRAVRTMKYLVEYGLGRGEVDR